MTGGMCLPKAPDNRYYIIPRPPNYQPSIFIGACKELSADPDTFEGVDCNRMLEYAKLPNDKYLINWPIFGNDYYLNLIEMDHQERKLLYEETKNRTRYIVPGYPSGRTHFQCTEES